MVQDQYLNQGLVVKPDVNSSSSKIVAGMIILILLLSGTLVFHPRIASADFSNTAKPIPSPLVSTVAQGNILAAEVSTDYYEGEKRLVPVGNVLFAFFNDTTDIVYKTSTDKGGTWSSSISTGITNPASDRNKWDIATTTSSGKNRIILLYSLASADNTNANFYAKSGTVHKNKVIWDNQTFLFSVSNPPGCAVNYGGGACAGAVASADTNGNVFVAFRWATSVSYHYEILESTDGGKSWTVSVPDTDTGDGTRNVMALAKLSSGKMLFVNALYSQPELFFRIFNGTSWNTGQYTIGSGLSTGVKQISSITNSTLFAYVAYLTGGTSGSLKVAKWNYSIGSFDSFETIDTTLSHSLPSITVSSIGNIHIFTLSNGRVYDTENVHGVWQLPSTPFGISFISPDQLTCGISGPTALWIEGSYPNVSLRFGSLGK